MIALQIFYYTLLFVNSYFLLLTIVNFIYIRVTTKKPKPFAAEEEPLVSVMIPTRNEENNIGECVKGLLEQEYQNYEILIIDDNSSDQTPQILADLEKEDSRVRIFKGKKLKEGWFGKPYALQQLSEEARGEYFLFVDADTRHTPLSISFSIYNTIYHKVDLFSAYPYHDCRKFGALLTIPIMYVMTSIALPLPTIKYLKLARASFCLGQYFCMKAETFRAVDGFERVKHKITEDNALSKELKRSGFKSCFLDGKEYVSCKMYSNYREAFNGFAKNIYSELAFSPFIFFLVCLLIFVGIGYPLVNTIIDWVSGRPPNLPIVLSFVLFSLSRIVTNLDRKVPLWSFIFYPIIFLQIFLMGIYDPFLHIFGKKIVWKGRSLDD